MHDYCTLDSFENPYALVLKSNYEKAKSQKSCHYLEPEADDQDFPHLSSFLCQVFNICPTHHLSGDYENHMQRYRKKSLRKHMKKHCTNKRTKILLLLAQHLSYSNFEIMASITTQIL